MGRISSVIVLTTMLNAALAVGQEIEPRINERRSDGAVIAPTRQWIKPAGRSIEVSGRPVDLIMAQDGRLLVAKDNRGLIVIDPIHWDLVQELAFPVGGSSMHGIAVSGDGSRVWATTAQNQLHEARLRQDKMFEWSRTIDLPGPGGVGAAHGCGIALSTDETTAYVALSRNNTIGVVDLEQGELIREIPVGVAPFDVVLDQDNQTLYVSNWGGRRPADHERTALSSGTPVLVDERGVASSGTIGKVDLREEVMVAEIATGLHPSDLLIDHVHARLYVANANSDTVGIINISDGSFQEESTILVRPHPDLLFGSATNALALSDDGATLYVANGGNNAVAVVGLDNERFGGELLGFIPTGWYPGSLAITNDDLYVANVKGIGSRDDRGEPNQGRSVYWYLGSITSVPLPDSNTLVQYTAQVRQDARVPQMLQSWQRDLIREKVEPKPVPEQLGDPSVFEHVVYIIKENRTYDQVFGDLPQGDGDPNLCIFERSITPNHHALAEQFVLLDNFYCNGVNSADGHSWATEGNVTDHLEKSFGGWTRSYTFGDDPLTYSSTGFIWDNVLLHGLTFRNYGEMDYADPIPADVTFVEILQDFQEAKHEITFKQKIGIETLQRYTSPDYPGWNMRIPEVVRADRFLKELAEYQESGDFPNFTIIYLPQDHCSGTSPGMPTPEAHMADNDLALGRIVEGISKSRFWPRSCIFVVEDDPQNGFDHVDGHRSIGLVISPYTQRGAVVSEFYNQTSVLHTMEQILGLPPMNQMDALSPLMSSCFTTEPDFRPYEALPVDIPLDRLNPPLAQLNSKQRYWAEASLRQDFRGFDRADEDTLNRILWHAIRGVQIPYPIAFAGAHGRGLKQRQLIHQPSDDDGQ